MKTEPRPRWAFDLCCSGIGDVYSATVTGDDIPQMSPARRLFLRVRGAVLQWAFGWWRWTGEDTTGDDDREPYTKPAGEVF